MRDGAPHGRREAADLGFDVVKQLDARERLGRERCIACTERRVVSVISNCTGRPVLRWMMMARSRTRPLIQTSSTLMATRSQARSLLSIAGAA
jgi:hypothetical protein